MRIIALCGPKGCGKDSAAKALYNQNQVRSEMLFRHAPMAEGVKNICEDFFGWTHTEMADMDFKETPREFWPGREPLEPRWPMMEIANYMRDFLGGEVHAERWAMHAKKFHSDWACQVVPDMRFPEELATFDREATTGFLPVYVFRPEAEEALSKKRAAGDGMANNQSESHYEMLYQYCKENGVVIPNDRDLNYLHQGILTAVKIGFTHWQYWQAKPLVTSLDLINDMRMGKF